MCQIVDLVIFKSVLWKPSPYVAIANICCVRVSAVTGSCNLHSTYKALWVAHSRVVKVESLDETAGLLKNECLKRDSNTL